MSESAPFDLAETDRLLTTTRAVRKRLDLDRAVPREVILDCIRISQQAPTGSNQQGWRWVVVTDADKKAALAEMYRKGGGAYLEASRANIQPGQEQTGRVLDSAAWLAENIEKAPVGGGIWQITPFSMQSHSKVVFLVTRASEEEDWFYDFTR